MKILIVDDDRLSREVLKKIFSAYPEHQTTAAENGTAAWELLDDPARYFDVVLLDIVMPEPDGLALLARIRKTPALDAMPVIMCSASSDRTTVANAIRLGARHFLVKPHSQAVVMAKLRQIFPGAFPEDEVHAVVAKA